jgi:serine/threonine protein kinase/formylglycine-generating enzyme required for sulfatase activity
MSDDARACRPGDARSIFAEYEARRLRGEAVDIDEYCERFPAFSLALRGLESLRFGVPEEDRSGLDPSAGASTAAVEEGAESTASSWARDAVEAMDAARETSSTLYPAVGGSGGFSRSLRVGDRVGPYVLEDLVGEGGFAQVYRALQERPVRRIVALKAVKRGVATREVIGRFELERQALAVMNHPGLAKVFDAGTTPAGQPYFVMEYVDGTPVTQHCDAQRATIRERLEVFVSICDAVQHAHQKGIIHRDLKPSNVLVTEENGVAVAKVIDFGVAKALDHDLAETTVETLAGEFLGTPLYMSPEQLDPTGGTIDTRSDIYALGVIAYELVTGSRPFDIDLVRKVGFAGIQKLVREIEPPLPSARLEEPGDLVIDIAERRSASASSLLRGVRGDLDWIIRKAMAKDPAERYASVSELSADVRRHLSYEPVLAGPPSFRYRFRKLLVRRRRDFLLGGTLVLLVILASIGAMIWSERRFGRQQIERSREAFERGKKLESEGSLARRELDGRVLEYERVVESLPTWRPIWDRGAEIAARDAVVEARHRLVDIYTRGTLEFRQALDLAARDSAERKRVEDGIESFGRIVGRDATGEVGREVVVALIASALERGPTSTARARVRLQSEPRDARVWCFRYEKRDEILVPLPFDVERGKGGSRHGIVGDTFLRVEKIWRASGLPFVPGDRIIQVSGRAVRTPTELVRAVLSIDPGKSVEVEITRNGEALRVDWTPRESGAPGEIVDLVDDLGVTFEAYPIDLESQAPIGSTGTVLDLDLEEGSYLFLFRREGFIDARLAVRVPLDLPGEISVRLVDRAPAGFLLVQGGPFFHGGDESAYQSLEGGVTDVPPFFMKRHEVTFDEYIEFLEHAETAARLRSMETAAGVPVNAARDGVVELLARVPTELRGDVRWVSLVPIDQKNDLPLVVRDTASGKWTTATPGRGSWPVIGVSYLASAEYAAWKTRQDPDGWVYRLPSDLEWEKAARGVDRRVHVWGDHPVWTFAWCYPSIRRDRPRLPSVVGRCPTDESVWGVRDLAGSAEELTSDRPNPRVRLISRRGGSWDGVSVETLRIATRNSMLPETRSRQSGIRLVAELERRPRASPDGR